MNNENQPPSLPAVPHAKEEEKQTWECGCGAFNGVNLAMCGSCNRARNEGEVIWPKNLEEPGDVAANAVPGQVALPFDFTPWVRPFTYDPHGTRVVDSKERIIVDIRGWGFLTGKGSEALGMNEERAVLVQDGIGKHVAQLLNASSVGAETRSDTGSEFSQISFEIGGRSALNLQRALEQIRELASSASHASLTHGDLIKRLAVVWDKANASLQSAQAASDGKEQGEKGLEEKDA